MEVIMKWNTKTKSPLTQIKFSTLEHSVYTISINGKVSEWSTHSCGKLIDEIQLDNNLNANIISNSFDYHFCLDGDGEYMAFNSMTNSANVVRTNNFEQPVYSTLGHIGKLCFRYLEV